MVGKFATLLFILPVIYARIEIEFSKLNEKERDVSISGNSVHVITDQEMRTFGLTESALRKSVWSYFGSLPDNVYVKGPTPWGDLYKILFWEPVKSVSVPTKAEILSANTEPTLILKKEFFNNKSEGINFKTELRQTIINTASGKWEKEGSSVDNIHHRFDLNFTSDTSFFSFISKLGEDFEKITPTTVASEVEVTLKPQQRLIAELFATKNTMMVRVDFETTLTGTVAVNFDKEYNGHRFWALDINTVLAADDLKKTMYASEIIEFVYFTDAKMLFRDDVTLDVIATVPGRLF